MMTKSPSGALSPYYYKGGYFHGIHYGSYFDNEDEIIDMIGKEEEFILKSPDRRRVMMDLYETELTDRVIERLCNQFVILEEKIVKLAVATDKKNLKKLRSALKKANNSLYLRSYFCTDMEEGKTWLVSDNM